jgi:hypothetical protein
MTRAEFNALCRGVTEGEERYVEDMTMHKTGKVLSCEGNRFQVELEGDRQTWPSETCRERWDISGGKTA